MQSKALQTVTIYQSSTPREIGELQLQFRKVGIDAANKMIRKRKQNRIKQLRFHFQNALGLDLSIRVTDFQKIEFQFFYHEEMGFQYFTFRINDEEFYGKVRPDIKGFKSYDCYDTGVAIFGETNREIERLLE